MPAQLLRPVLMSTTIVDHVLIEGGVVTRGCRAHPLSTSSHAGLVRVLIESVESSLVPSSLIGPTTSLVVLAIEQEEGLDHGSHHLSLLRAGANLELGWAR